MELPLTAKVLELCFNHGIACRDNVEDDRCCVHRSLNKYALRAGASTASGADVSVGSEIA